MISPAAAAPTAVPPRRPRFATHLGAIAQLAAVGLVGPVIFSVLVTLLSLGLSLVLVVGIGLLFLVAAVLGLIGKNALSKARPKPERAIAEAEKTIAALKG